MKGIDMANAIFLLLWGTLMVITAFKLSELTIYCSSETSLDKPIPKHPVLTGVTILCIICMVIMVVLRAFGVPEFGP